MWIYFLNFLVFLSLVKSNLIDQSQDIQISEPSEEDANTEMIGEISKLTATSAENVTKENANLKAEGRSLPGYSSGLLSNDHSAYWVLNEAERAINAKKAAEERADGYEKAARNAALKADAVALLHQERAAQLSQAAKAAQENAYDSTALAGKISNILHSLKALNALSSENSEEFLRAYERSNQISRTIEDLTENLNNMEREQKRSALDAQARARNAAIQQNKALDSMNQAQAAAKRAHHIAVLGAEEEAAAEEIGNDILYDKNKVSKYDLTGLDSPLLLHKSPAISSRRPRIPRLRKPKLSSIGSNKSSKKKRFPSKSSSLLLKKKPTLARPLSPGEGDFDGLLSNIQGELAYNPATGKYERDSSIDISNPDDAKIGKMEYEYYDENGRPMDAEEVKDLQEIRDLYSNRRTTPISTLGESDALGGADSLLGDVPYRRQDRTLDPAGLSAASGLHQRYNGDFPYHPMFD